MRKKLVLDPDQLRVTSFATAPEAPARAGTVRAHGTEAGEDPPLPTPPVIFEEGCTRAESCLCETAYYHCGTGPATIWSCTFTQDERCG